MNHKTSGLIVMCLIAALCLPAVVSAKNLRVPSDECRTISLAMLKAKAGDTVWVAKGTYNDHVVVGDGVVLMASPSDKVTISAGGKGEAVTLSKNSCVNGFIIMDAAIGVFSDGTGNRILNCRLIRNWQSGIMALRGLPQIENNLIAFNRGSGIVLWDCRGLGTTINHNTIAYNNNNGLIVGGTSEMTLANNIIAFNSRMALRVATEKSRVAYVNNDLFGNLAVVLQTPPNSLVLDPLFTAPHRGDFTLARTSPCLAKGADGQNLGALILE